MRALAALAAGALVIGALALWLGAWTLTQAPPAWRPLGILPLMTAALAAYILRAVVGALGGAK